MRKPGHIRFFLAAANHSPLAAEKAGAVKLTERPEPAKPGERARKP